MDIAVLLIIIVTTKAIPNHNATINIIMALRTCSDVTVDNTTNRVCLSMKTIVTNDTADSSLVDVTCVGVAYYSKTVIVPIIRFFLLV